MSALLANCDHRVSKALQAGDVVLVQFPYADRAREKYRPALIISSSAFHKRYGVCWLAMITSAANAPCQGDIHLSPSTKTGLNTDSVIRPMKLATIDLDQVTKIGTIPATIGKRTLAFIRKQLV